MKKLIISLLTASSSATSCQNPPLEAHDNWRELTSPLWPHGIEANTGCEWVIKAQEGKRVQITFDQLLLSDYRDEDDNCVNQSLDLIDGSHREVESSYISFCDVHRPSIDFVSTNETMRVLLKSQMKKKDLTGEERFMLKYRFIFSVYKCFQTYTTKGNWWTS